MNEPMSGSTSGPMSATMARLSAIVLHRARSFRPRLLPVSIVAMALLFVVKMAALLQLPGAPAAIFNAGNAVMPSAKAAESETHAAPPAKPEVHGQAKPAAAQVAPAPPPVDPGPSEAERALLMDLRARRTALDERTHALESREALAAAAERRLDERVDQLAALQTKLEAMESTRRERDEANWRGLVKTYETMRPRDAALIFNDLDQSVLLQVLDRMKESKAAPVLAAMQPERARLITAELAKWRSRAPAGQP
jgi:flagellar motility protein MotE (MotC chaperone)